ncbi:hypothetical protein N7540_006671 [Penicillium herquei]|nr:hypothetical protein N7540_006671 [Penicillium herquei]
MSSISPERMGEYCGDSLRNVAIAFLVLETVAIGLRFISLHLSRKRFGIDDILAISAYICCLGTIILTFVFKVNSLFQLILNRRSLTLIFPWAVDINYGHVGYHEDAYIFKYPQSLNIWGRCTYATPIIWSAACCFPRLMLLALYLRIFERHQKYRIACYSLMVVLVAFAFADIFVSAFICWPIHYLWAVDHDGRCINIWQFYRYGTLPNIFIDLFMLVLPMPIVWRLQVSRQVKIGLGATFLTGSIGLATSIARTVTFFKHDPVVDPTWIAVTFLIWSIVEPGVYLIAACLPCYRPLIKFVLERSGKAITVRTHSRAESSNDRISKNSSYSVRKDKSLHAGWTKSQSDIEMGPPVLPKISSGQESDEQSLISHRI